VASAPSSTAMVTFSFVAMDQIVNQASKIRYMFAARRFPVTYRCTTGGGMGLAAQHSQTHTHVDAPGRV